MDITNELQNKVTKLFEENIITRFIGYEQGSLPYKARPIIITNKTDIPKLVFNPFCVNNISIYTRNYVNEKVGILAYPCTLRSIVALIQANQIKKENLYIIAVNCFGMIDPDKIKDLSLLEIKSIEEKNDIIILHTKNGNKELNKQEIIYDKCKTCNYELPKIYNDLLNDEKKVNPNAEKEYDEINEIEKLPLEKRWEFWQKEFSKCIRCYACKNVCPICYCKECIVDKTSPQWISKLNQDSVNEYYGLIRVIHMFGRCVDCGECERVCPVKIPLRKMLKKMEKDVKELYGYKPGMDPDVPPPLAVYKEDDPEKGIIK